MAVQKSKKSRSKSKSRRNSVKLPVPTLVTDPTTGELVKRHQVTAKGFYKGKQVVEMKSEA
ncbi:50S ribosomal protein L32 [Gammaproteobacteria bacterium]|nr:50S ribosomal protein L32 [Gammaproteobacteria bacterium]